MIRILMCTLLLIPNLCAYAQSFSWASKLGYPGSYKYIDEVVTDAQSNVYISGVFESKIDCDPGPGVYDIVSGLQYYAAFLIKLDSAGNFIWGMSPSSANTQSKTQIRIDAAGNCYFSCQSTVSKIDASGNTIWSKTVGSMTQGDGRCLALDQYGNVYHTGTFSGTVDFDPGIGVANLTAQTFGGYGDIYVVKLNNSGDFVWAKQIEGDPAKSPQILTCDASGNLYIAGFFSDSVDVDMGPGKAMVYAVYKNSQELFYAKYDSSGTYQWANKITRTGDDYASDLDIDGAGNVYFLCTNNPLGVNAQSTSLFCVDSTGAALWGITIGNGFAGNGVSMADMAIGQNGNIFLMGGIYGTADIDPGSNVQNYTATGIGSALLLKLDNTGGLVNARMWHGVDSSRSAGSGLSLNVNDDIFYIGNFTRTVDFDPGPGVANLVSDRDTFVNYWMQNMYIGKLNYSSVSVAPLEKAASSVTIFPNPASDYIDVQGLVNIDEKVVVTDVSGKDVSSLVHVTNAGRIVVQNLSQGFYYITTSRGAGAFLKK